MDYKTAKSIITYYLPSSLIAKKALEFLREDDREAWDKIQLDLMEENGALNDLEHIAALYLMSQATAPTQAQAGELIKYALLEGIDIQTLATICCKVIFDLDGNRKTYVFIPRCAKWLEKTLDIVETILCIFGVNYNITETIDGYHIYSIEESNNESISSKS